MPEDGPVAPDGVPYAVRVKGYVPATAADPVVQPALTAASKLKTIALPSGRAGTNGGGGGGPGGGALGDGGGLDCGGEGVGAAGADGKVGVALLIATTR